MKLSEKLAGIKILYRADDTLSLWGLPHEMRKGIGQQPRDIVRGCGGNPSNVPGWIWLGSPGWWGTYSGEDIRAIEAFLADVKSRDEIPENPHEWCYIAPHHASDADCAGHILPNDLCGVCGAYHGDPCPVCGGRGFHLPTCEP